MRIKKTHLQVMAGVMTLVVVLAVAIPLALANGAGAPPPPDCGKCTTFLGGGGDWIAHCVHDAECECWFIYEDGVWVFDEGGACCPACLVEPSLPKVPSLAIWLADVCEPNDGFSDDGAMTWDSDTDGPLEFAASMEGPWYSVEVNGPPWVVTEGNMESFAAMVGVEDWRDMWVRAGGCYPQHVGNTVDARDARMDELCE